MVPREDIFFFFFPNIAESFPAKFDTSSPDQREDMPVTIGVLALQVTQKRIQPPKHMKSYRSNLKQTNALVTSEGM